MPTGTGYPVTTSPPEPRHFAVPFRFEQLHDGTVRVASTPQDSTAEIADCVDVIVRTVAGQRATLPRFGRPDSIEFTDNPALARTELAAAIDEFEPRASAAVDGDIDPTDPGILRLKAMFDLAGE